jgi:hypothetical protein
MNRCQNRLTTVNRSWTMKYILVFLIFCCQGALAKDWYEGVWVFDPGLTQRNNPGINSEGMKITRDGFDKWAGQIGVGPRRIKGKRAKLGVPYRVISRDRQSVSLEVKGGVVEIVKAFNPNLRKMKLQCRVIKISNNVAAFDVPELRTIRMYLRRVR